MRYKDKTLIDDVITYTPGFSWIVEPNIVVQYSRPYFFPSQCKRKNSGLASETKGAHSYTHALKICFKQALYFSTLVFLQWYEVILSHNY